MRTKLFAVCLALPALFVLSAAADDGPPLGEQFRNSFQTPPAVLTAPDTVFAGADGVELQMADFRGRVLLVNFWATWCLPCVREMPSLDRLQAKLSDEGLVVLTVSNDRGGEPVIRRFYEELSLQNLGVYSDARAKLAAAFGVRGLPTSYIVDADGTLLGRVQGHAEWDEPDAVALIRYYLDKARSAGHLKAGTG